MAVVMAERGRSRELARAGRLSVRLAAAPAEIEAAQRLRWQVFSEELGARLGSGADRLDRDAFDRFCEHLIVEDGSTGEIVGTYRVLFPTAALRAGCLYIETQFFTDRLRGVRSELVELGRSCVHPDYRTGATIMLLWSGLALTLTAKPPTPSSSNTSVEMPPKQNGWLLFKR